MASTSNSTLKGDNPCWGSPDECDLNVLLSQIPSQCKSILYESDDFLVLNKPPDLRMDGPYPSTVEKLLVHWYPASSSTGANQHKNNNKVDHNKVDQTASLQTNTPLTLSQVNGLRPCHQLDYATSGVLLFAKSQSAAARAGACFEQRSTQKTYLAVVKGHLKLGEPNTKTLPILQHFTPQAVQEALAQIEDRYKRTRRKPTKKATFPGYLPPHTLYQRWMALQERTQKQGTTRPDDLEDGFQRRSKRPKHSSSTLLTPDEWNHVWSCLDAVWNQVRTDQDAMYPAWKDIKFHPKWRPALDQCTKAYNDLARERLSHSSSQTNGNDRPVDDLPRFFGCQEDPNSFYVYTALAQTKDQFAMLVQQQEDVPWSSITTTKDAEKEKELDYKPSLTKCTILQRGHYKGHAVTKVQLEPWTGRRHQLRVHMALVRHPILGDVTYSCSLDSMRSSGTASGRDTNTAEQGSSSPPSCHRMCLHAFQLQILDMNVTSPDPFPMDAETGSLSVRF